MPEHPLREDDLRRTDEPDRSGQWNPEVHRQDRSIGRHPQPSWADEEPDTPDEAILYSPEGDDDEDEMDIGEVDDRMLSTLRTAGVSEDAAFHFIKAMRQRTRRTRHKAAASFIEMYGGGSICEEAEKSKRSLNLDGLNAFDLRTLKPDGTPWNFCRRKDREEARK